MLEAEQAAKNLPSTQDTIDQIGKRVGQEEPAAAHQMLTHFKDISWNAMNSFVHGGIHPLRRNADGFPVHLALQVLRNSNGLGTMTAMTMTPRLPRRFRLSIVYALATRDSMICAFFQIGSSSRSTLRSG